MEDGIGDLLGLEYSSDEVRQAMRPMLMELMCKMKRELKTELTAQFRKDIRLLMTQYKHDEAATIGPLVPTATRVADEKGFVDHRVLRRSKHHGIMLVSLPDEERGWFNALRKFNKAD